MRRAKGWWNLPAVLLAVSPSALQAAPRHPLDALDASEIAATTAVLRSAGHVDDRTLLAMITLLEPPKADVLAWEPGDSVPRRAKAVLRRESATFEAIVDLDAGTLASFTKIPGAQPFITVPEIQTAIAVTTSDPRMRQGLLKRGITDFEQLFCAPRTVGNFGRDSERTK